MAPRSDGVTDFEALRSRTSDHHAIACGFDLLMFNGDDLRRRPFVERKVALAKLLLRSRGGIQYVEHAEGHGYKMFTAEEAFNTRRIAPATSCLNECSANRPNLVRNFRQYRALRAQLRRKP
jgi:hypothetical protein